VTSNYQMKTANLGSPVNAPFRPPEADIGGYGGSSPREARAVGAPDRTAVFAIERVNRRGQSC
jgi:hypothetical protein